MENEEGADLSEEGQAGDSTNQICSVGGLSRPFVYIVHTVKKRLCHADR